MYTLGEMGISVGLAWLVSYGDRFAVDFRLVLLGSILPDLIDKPLGAILHLDARLWAHSLLFLGGILVLSLWPTLRGLRWVGFGDAVHLLVDLMWYQPTVALWPLLGFAFPAGEQSFGNYLQIFLTDPYVQFGEITGAIFLLWTVWACHLDSWPVLRQFLKDGRLVRRPAAA